MTDTNGKSNSGSVVELRAARVPGWTGWFADHHWLLVLRGVVGQHFETCDRWEVWQHEQQGDPCWGHLHLNLLKPFQGVGNGPSRSVHQWVGDDATELISRIENSPETYPLCNSYRYWPGPNSNTFAQWVLGDKMSLGPRGIGKCYPVPTDA